jgi:hypothetical protein
MSICSEYLHCFHWEFEQQSPVEKAKWYAFVEAKSKEYEKEQKVRDGEARARAAESKAQQLQQRGKYK